jgi:hypothetical protein
VRHAAAAVAATLGMMGTAAAAPCMTQAEVTAEQARGLQSALMVAALKCVHKSSLKLYENYNAFVTRYNHELTAHSEVMQGYFQRSYGKGHKHALNKYMTTLANHFSLNTFGNPKFCEDMATAVQAVLAAGDGAVLRGEFETGFLPPTSAPMCNSMASKDVPTLSGRIPDLAAIHMPDLDARPRQSAANAAAPEPAVKAD